MPQASMDECRAYVKSALDIIFKQAGAYDFIVESNPQDTARLTEEMLAAPVLGASLRVLLRATRQVPGDQVSVTVMANGSTTSVYRLGVRVRINWTATERTIPNAYATVQLYVKAVEVASLIDTLLNR